MKDLVYKNERTLFVIAAILAAIIWTLAIIGTVGVILAILLLFFLSYLFVHAGFIAWIKGNGIEVTSEQFPDLYTRYNECCAKLNIKEPPRLYILNSDGMLNALATRFLRKDFVVLFSSIVDALERKPSLVKFYIGHELAHIQRGHLSWGPFLAPALWLPLLGSAYSRAREYTCDRYGLTCSDSPVDACYALTVLASGDRKWAEVKMTAFLKQVEETRGFWMSFHELTNDYPWLTKRLAHIVALGRGQTPDMPRRHPLAYLFAFFTPRSAVPGAGAIFFFVAFIGVLAAIAFPKFQEYVMQSQMAEMESQFQMPTEPTTDPYATEPSAESSAESSYTDNTVTEQSSETAATTDLGNTLISLQYIATAYVDAYKAHPIEQVTLEMMELTESDLQSVGIAQLQLTETAMEITLNAIDENTGSNHTLRIVAAYEADGNAMFARCSDTSLTVEQLEGICRQQ